jgi:hypothetical protein
VLLGSGETLLVVADTATLVARAKYKRLPHTHCALSLLEFETPVCDSEGNVFDLLYVFASNVSFITISEQTHPAVFEKVWR